MIKQRSLIGYILLTLVTAGIYGIYWIYKYAKDLNTMCAGDGGKTGGALAFFLLAPITCGIYPFVWYYKAANRLQQNAPRYGLMFKESGSTVLLWGLLGSLLCGIGAFVMLHILIKNFNAMAGAYNNLAAQQGYAAQ